MKIMNEMVRLNSYELNEELMYLEDVKGYRLSRIKIGRLDAIGMKVSDYCDLTWELHKNYEDADVILIALISPSDDGELLHADTYMDAQLIECIEEKKESEKYGVDDMDYQDFFDESVYT